METVARPHLYVSSVCYWLVLIVVSIWSLLSLHTVTFVESGLLSCMKAINSKLSFNLQLSEAICNTV